MFLEPNMPVSVDDLLHGMIVQSGNDASIALAETIAGNDAQFVQRMNAKAQQLGLRATQFRNPTGLPDPEHFTTANDLAQLVTHLINDYPEQYGFYKIKEFSYNNVKQPNRNRLLWSDPSVDGVKTGHTDAAGYCLIASAKRGNRRLLSIVLGTPSDQARAQESQKLLNYGFSQFETVTAHAQSRVVETVKIWQGQQAQIPVGFTQDRYITIPTGMSPKLTRQFVPDAKQQPLVAPITAGTPVGTLKLMLNQQVVAELPVVALESVAEANWLARMWDRLRMKWAS
jgi:D-alanyl-D-alanine carboxypeptidase (penicillin-binding protein 5/6)